MGGTSTDVSHFQWEYERAFETEVAGVRMRAPMMLIHTVAAGGGSILHFDGARMRVGPDSAGANPGPKSYRRGGPLTVTDANVMVGKLIPDFFPKIFGPRQNEPLDADAVRSGFAELAREVGGERTAEQVADGFIRIAVENMANAIKKISVQRGYDVTQYALNCFGGAGGQHACLVADALGMRTVLIHPLSSLLSAYGMGLADIRATRQQALEVPLDAQGVAALRKLALKLGREARREVTSQGVHPDHFGTQVHAHVRYAGTDAPLSVLAVTLARQVRASQVARAAKPTNGGVSINESDLLTPRDDGRPTTFPTIMAADLEWIRGLFEKAHGERFGFVDKSEGAHHRGGLGRGGGSRRAAVMGAGASDHATPCPPPHVVRASIPMAPGMRLRCSPTISSSRATRSPALRSSSSRIRPSWSRTAGRRSSTCFAISSCAASSRAHVPARSAPMPTR